MLCWSTIWRILTGYKPNPIPSKVQVTYSTACKFVSALGYPVDTTLGAVNLLALEGTRPGSLPDLVEIHNNLHAPDAYNDSLILFGKDTEGQGWSRVLLCTTEPGRFYTEVNPHREGAANLVWGHHLYKQGKHRGYLALISASGYDRIWRDKDADYTQDLGERVYEGQFGIHIHAGGKRKEIGKWSAGCIAVQGGEDGEPWQFLLAKIRKHPNKLFNLILWGAQDLARFMVEAKWRPMLYFGIRNVIWCGRLQRILNKKLGISLTIDGDFGAQTQKALDAFCDSHGLVRTCIMDDIMWRRLDV